ncbi:alkaline-phosphatase-like protein, partial [Chytriomyces sp. MP71]
TLSVYADTSSSDSLDDPKVETLAEIIRRNRPGMCIGVVTTASVLDATPAAMFGHTRSRGQGQVLVDQALNGFRYLVNNGTGNVWTPGAEPMPWGPAVKPDVLLGGGGEWFIGDSPINGTNYYDQYAKSGYNVVYDKDGLTGVSSGPVLGIFTMGHMDTWYDREVEKVNLAINSASSPKNDGKSATNQPGLQQMTLKAIEIMEKKCADGYFLMSEAAAIDKSMHPMDYDRGLADLLEFDRTVQAVRALPSAKDTAILLTADHSQGFDVYGSVDLGYFRSASDSDAAGADGAGNSPASALAGQHIQQRQAVGVYQDAGWIDNVLDDQGLPTKFKDARFRFASGKVDMPAHVENYEFKTPAAGTNPLSRNPAVNNVNRKKNVTLGFHDTSLTSIYVADPTDAPKGGVPRPGNLPANSGSSVHTLQAVDLYCYGPGSYKCSGVHDNTEVFFILADILGLGDKADTQDPYTPGAPTYSQGCAPASSASAAPAASSNAAYVASSVAPAASTPSSSTPSAYVAPVVANTKPAPQNLYSGANAVAMTAAVAALVALAF